MLREVELNILQWLASLVGAAMLALLFDRVWEWVVEVLFERRDARRAQRAGEPIEDASHDPEAPPPSPAPRVPAGQGYTPQRRWCANKSTVHLVGCKYARNTTPINVWTSDGAAKWAQAEKLKSCRHCWPFTDDALLDPVTELHPAPATQVLVETADARPAPSDQDDTDEVIEVGPDDVLDPRDWRAYAEDEPATTQLHPDDITEVTR